MGLFARLKRKEKSPSFLLSSKLSRPTLVETLAAQTTSLASYAGILLACHATILPGGRGPVDRLTWTGVAFQVKEIQMPLKLVQ